SIVAVFPRAYATPPLTHGLAGSTFHHVREEGRFRGSSWRHYVEILRIAACSVDDPPPPAAQSLKPPLHLVVRLNRLQGRIPPPQKDEIHGEPLVGERPSTSC